MNSIANGTVIIQTSSESVPSTPSWFGEVTLLVRYLRKHDVLTGVAPFLEGVQIWKLNQWRFIKKDEKHGEDILHLYIQSISYRHLFVKIYLSFAPSLFSLFFILNWTQIR